MPKIKKGNIAYKQALDKLKRDLSNVLRDKSISQMITKVISTMDSINKVMDALKKETSAGGDWKQKMAQSMLKQGIRKIAINTAENLLKTAEIPKIVIQVNILVKNNLNKIDQDLKGKEDMVHELSKQEEEQIDDELDKFCTMMSGRISSDIVAFINGIANGVFQLGLSAATTAITDKVEEKLSTRFARKNEIKKRDEECRQIKKDLEKKKAAKSEEEKKVEKKIEKDVVSPKGTPDSGGDDETDMNLGHAQMLANKEGRRIKIRDLTTGEIIILEPEGTMGKIMAAFKDEGVADFVQNQDGGGHFKTGVGSEKFIQKDGDRNCLLISIDESLGREVTDESIKQKRRSIDRNTSENESKYEESLKKMAEQGHSHVEGGARKGINT